MVWAGACFQDLPNHTTAIYFPNCSCQNFPDLCSVLHLQGHLVNVWHSQAAFYTILFKPLLPTPPPFPAYGDLANTLFIKNLMTKKQSRKKKNTHTHNYQNISVCFELDSLLLQWTNILCPVWQICFCFMDTESSNSLDSLFVTLLGKWAPDCSPCMWGAEDLSANV